MSRTVVILTLFVALACPFAFSSQQDGTGADKFDSFLHQGFEYHQKNEYSAAIPLLRKAWKLRSHDYFVNLLLGIDLLRTGQAEESITFLQEATRQKPKEEFAYEYLGEAYAALDRQADAFDSFKRGIVAAPDSSEAKTSFVGFCLARFAELSSRMRGFSAGLAAEYRLQALSRPRTDPSRVDLLLRATSLDDDPENWIQLALTQIAIGDTTAGTQSLERARILAPEDIGIAEAEAMVAATQRNWAVTNKFLNAIALRSPAALARMYPDWPESLYPVGQSQLAASAAIFLECIKAACGTETLQERLPKPKVAPDVAVETLFQQQRWESVTQLHSAPNPKGEATFQRGIAWAETGDCAKAIPLLERSLGPKTTTASAMFHLSRCYASQADKIAAELSKSLKDQAIVHLLRGDVLLRLQADSKAAIAEYQAAVTARPEDPAGWERLGEAQLAAGSAEDARKSAEYSLKLDPHRLPAMRTLAQAAMQERNYPEALPFLRELAKQNPRDLTTRVQLATACSQTGELQEALKYLDSALMQGYPDEKGSLHYQLGTILRGLGRATEATQAFAEAKTLSDRFQNTSLRDKESRE